MILNLNQSGEWISRFVDSLVLDFCQVTPAAEGAPGGTTASAATPAQAYSTILFHQVRSAAPEISLPVNHERLQSAVFGFSRYVAELFVRSVGIKIQSEPAFRDFITEADRAFAQDRELAQRNEAELLRVIERHFARQQAGEANPVPAPAPTPTRN